MFTLGLHLGPLTRVSIVLVSAEPLIGPRPFPRFYDATRVRSLLAGAEFYLHTPRVQCSTTRAISAETILRDPLAGTSHSRSRLAFYP